MKLIIIETTLPVPFPHSMGSQKHVCHISLYWMMKQRAPQSWTPHTANALNKAVAGTLPVWGTTRLGHYISTAPLVTSYFLASHDSTLHILTFILVWLSMCYVCTCLDHSTSVGQGDNFSGSTRHHMGSGGRAQSGLVASPKLSQVNVASSKDMFSLHPSLLTSHTHCCVNINLFRPTHLAWEMAGESQVDCNPGPATPHMCQTSWERPGGSYHHHAG